MSRQDPLMHATKVSGSGERDGDDIVLHVDLHLQLEDIADVEAEHLSLGARRTPMAKELRHLAHKIYQERRLRDKLVEEKLFGEPAWDMLLALYCLPARGEILTVSSLTCAAELAGATGVRWQKHLSDMGLMETGPQGVDGRKKLVRLTQSGLEFMERILARLFYLNVPAPLALPTIGKSNGVRPVA